MFKVSSKDTRTPGTFYVHLIVILKTVQIHRSTLLHRYYNQFHKRCCFYLPLSLNWDQKKVVDKKRRLILRKIKETIQFLKNPHYFQKISYMLPEYGFLVLSYLTISNPTFWEMKLTQTWHFCVRKTLQSIWIVTLHNFFSPRSVQNCIFYT